jgi:hypothetical protein
MSRYPKGYVINADRPDACKVTARSLERGGGCESPWANFLAVNKGKYTGENWREKASKAYQRQCKKYANMDKHARRRGVKFSCDDSKVADSDYWKKRGERQVQMTKINALAKSIRQDEPGIPWSTAMSLAFEQEYGKKKPKAKTANKKISKTRKRSAKKTRSTTKKAGSKKKSSTKKKAPISTARRKQKKINEAARAEKEKTPKISWQEARSRAKVSLGYEGPAESSQSVATAAKKRTRKYGFSDVMDTLIRKAESGGRTVDKTNLDAELLKYITDAVMKKWKDEALERGEWVSPQEDKTERARAEILAERLLEQAKNNVLGDLPEYLGTFPF